MNYKAYRQTLADLISAEDREWDKVVVDDYSARADTLYRKRSDLKDVYTRRYKTEVDGMRVLVSLYQYDWGFSVVGSCGENHLLCLLRMEDGAYTHRAAPVGGSRGSDFLRRAEQAIRDWVDGKIEELPLAISET